MRIDFSVSHPARLLGFLRELPTGVQHTMSRNVLCLRNVLRSDAVEIKRLPLLPILDHLPWGRGEHGRTVLLCKERPRFGGYLLCIIINKDYNHHNPNN